MEETKTIQTLSILLYSRTLDTLYLQFNDAQTKQLATKVYVNTSAHTWLNFSMILANVHIMVKRNQENMQILHQFPLINAQPPGILQNMGHYLKIKKKFGNFELLFHIFFKTKSTLNSLHSLIPTRQDFAHNATHTNFRPSSSQMKSAFLDQLKLIAQSNLTLITARATTTVLNPIQKKKISLPTEQMNTRPFRKRKDKKTLTYNARINKLRKDQSKTSYTTAGGLKYKSKAISQKEMSGMTQTVINDDMGEDTVVGRSRTNGNALILRKQKKALDACNTDELSSQATKLSFTRRAKSKNRINFIDSSLSIGTNREQLPEPTFKKYFTQNQTIIEEKFPKFSHSIHQKIMEETCENHSEIKEASSAVNEKREFVYERKQDKMREIQGRSENQYENLRFLCGKVGSRGNSRVRGISYERKCRPGGISRSQQVQSQHQQENLLKKCYNATRASRQFLNPNYKKTSKLKQQFYQDLYLRTLESIQNQTQILHYVKTQCQTLNSVSIKRQNRQYTTIERAKENVNGKRKTEMVNRQKKAELEKKKKKAEEGYLLKVNQVSMPVSYFKY